MKTKVLFFVLFIFTGCAPINFIDTVPAGSSKGYVEFYYLKSEGNVGITVPVYSIVNNQSTFEGRTSNWDVGSNKIGLRIAKIPGTYTFTVNVASYRTKCVIQIKEGLITPVKIIFTDISKSSSYVPGGYMSSGGLRTSTSFNLYLRVLEPVPISEYDKK